MKLKVATVKIIIEYTRLPALPGVQTFLKPNSQNDYSDHLQERVRNDL
jgi:hypothetical protein